MNLTIDIVESTVQRAELHIKGEIDLYTVHQLITAIETCQSIHIVLDCKELLFIDSTGIGFLLRKSLEMIESNRQLSIESLPVFIYELFDEVGFFEIIQEQIGGDFSGRE